MGTIPISPPCVFSRDVWYTVGIPLCVLSPDTSEYGWERDAWRREFEREVENQQARLHGPLGDRTTFARPCRRRRRRIRAPAGGQERTRRFGVACRAGAQAAIRSVQTRGKCMHP